MCKGGQRILIFGMAMRWLASKLLRQPQRCGAAARSTFTLWATWTDDARKLVVFPQDAYPDHAGPHDYPRTVLNPILRRFRGVVPSVRPRGAPLPFPIRATAWGAVPVRRFCSMVRAAAFFLLVLVAATVAGAGISGMPSVTDGDTLRIGPERIRLHGIDAPESKQRCRAGGETWACGVAATRALRERIGGRPLECSERDRDRYGRIVAVCRVDGAEVNAWMVEQGSSEGLFVRLR